MTFHSLQYADSDNSGFVTQTSNVPLIKKLKTKGKGQKEIVHNIKFEQFEV